MKRLITSYILLLGLLVLTACEGGGGEQASQGGTDIVNPTPTPTPTPTPVPDHSSRSPEYDTAATDVECAIIAQGHLGVNKTWFFDYGHPARYLRIDKDGATMREWVVNHYQNTYIYNTWFSSGNCDIRVNDSLQGVAEVWLYGTRIF